MVANSIASEILGHSPAVRLLRRQLVAAARAPATVLLIGETGTGKGLAARALHALSDRRRLPFVHVDCAALSPGLVESELFGHERGAFTGAGPRRSGRLERAGAGTLFLDEVGELAPPLQAKWLRVLQDREFERVGGDRTMRLEARLVAATHRDLRAEVEAGWFRADLYFRLAVVRLRVPPLRERTGDAALIASAALPRIARRLGCDPPRPHASLLEALERHPWPGNLRELFNVLESLVVHQAGRVVGRIEIEPFLEAGAGVPGAGARWHPVSVGMGSGELRDRAARALERHSGNVARAARELGWARSTLRYRMTRWGWAGSTDRTQPISTNERATR